MTDIDHSQSWESGGETNPTNLGLLCRRHHRMKTHGGWKIESHADGSCTWTSPQGKVHKVPARPIDEIA
ncbi:MAG: HNH endonuclease signature motif containing protein [Candidatus Nanopelagicaceae bacterium]